MSKAVLIIAAIEALLLVTGLLMKALTGSRSDLAGDGMTAAYAIIGTVVALLLIGPAAAMAWHGKLPWLALAMVLLAAIFVLAVLVSGL